MVKTQLKLILLNSVGSLSHYTKLYFEFLLDIESKGSIKSIPIKNFYFSVLSDTSFSIDKKFIV